MEKELIKGSIGQVGEYDAKISQGRLWVGVSFGLGNLLDAIKKVIPGTLDDKIIDLAKGALGLNPPQA